MNYVIDTSAWIEYFEGSKKAVRLISIFDDPNHIKITPEAVVGEIYTWAHKHNIEFVCLLDTIGGISNFERITLKDWIQAARIKVKERQTNKSFGLTDGLMSAISIRLNAKLITADKHFKKMKNVIII